MVLTRRALLAATGASLTMAGCLGGGGGSGSSDGGGGDAAGDATVRVRAHEALGDILVDAGGMTLYRFDADTQGSGESACTDGCADTWPPLTVDDEPSAGDGISAPLTTFDRGDGTTQMAADGWPLYYFASDGSPGDAKGQGVNDVWWVVGPDGAKVTASEGDAGPGY